MFRYIRTKINILGVRSVEWGSFKYCELVNVPIKVVIFRVWKLWIYNDSKHFISKNSVLNCSLLNIWLEMEYFRRKEY